MKPDDCKGCKYLQTVTYKSITNYHCLHNDKPIHLFDECPRNRPMTTVGFLRAVKLKMLAMIGDGKDTKEESLRNVVKWIDSIEQDCKAKRK